MEAGARRGLPEDGHQIGAACQRVFRSLVIAGIQTMFSLPQGFQKIGEGRQAEIFAWTDGAILKLYRDPAARLATEWEAWP